MADPAWRNDEPANLAAAATDALEWLRLLHQLGPQMPCNAETREKLRRCIEALERELRR